MLVDDQDGDAAMTSLLTLLVHLQSAGQYCEFGEDIVALAVNASKIQKAESAAFVQESLFSALLTEVTVAGKQHLQIRCVVIIAHK